MPVPAAGKRQRRWAPKTRTGCKTCKVRRKKCDEQKPSCERCIKDKFQCDGYEPSKVWVFEPSGEDWAESSSPNLSLPTRSPSTDSNDESVCLRNHNSTFESEDDEKAKSRTWDLVLRDPRLSEFLLEPANPWTDSLDQNYTQYFLRKTAPLLSSTRRWQNFWQCIVPQAAWANASVRHAMIAVSLTFDSLVSGTDHKAMILSRRKKAINAFANEPSSSWEVGLIICRLFSSMAQCNEDFEGAMTHMKAGEKMLLEASQKPQHRSSEVVRLMAATFMGLFADSTIDFDVIKRFPPQERVAFRVLQKICSEYALMLRRITASVWEDRIEAYSMGFLSVVFTTLNQAISSAMYPDVLVFSPDDGINTALEVYAQLVEEKSLLSFGKLKQTYHPLFDEVEAFFDAPLPPELSKYTLPSSLQLRLRHFVDNYVVQAHRLEPRMTAGTFWLPKNMYSGCIYNSENMPITAQSGITACPHRPCSDPEHGCHIGDENQAIRERREYYHEFVCQYRSGFMI